MDRGRGGSQSDELAENQKKPPRCGPIDSGGRGTLGRAGFGGGASVATASAVPVPSSGSFTASSRLVSWVRQR